MPLSKLPLTSRWTRPAWSKPSPSNRVTAWTAALSGANDNQTLRFKLKNGFERGQRYRVRVIESAQSQAGLAMLRPFEFASARRVSWRSPLPSRPQAQLRFQPDAR